VSRRRICLSLCRASPTASKLRPYPFDAHPLRVQHIYKKLETRDFATEDAFLEVYYAAVPRSQEVEFI
jgi:hypothetical protein